VGAVEAPEALHTSRICLSSLYALISQGSSPQNKQRLCALGTRVLAIRFCPLQSS
jgi:hypothetical protein